MKKHWAKAVIALGLLAASLSAQGIAVIDAAAIVKLAAQIEKMKEQINWLRSQWEVQTQTYEQIYWNAKWLKNKARWKAAIMSWRYPAYPNASGRTGPWATASRDAAGAVGAIISVASRLPNVIDAYGHFGAADLDELKRKHYAKLEIDGATQVNTLETLADVRSVQDQRKQAIDQLEAAMLSDADLENTEAAYLGKIGAASMIQIRNQQDQMRLQERLVDMMLQQRMRERDAMVDAASREAAFLSGHRKASADIFGGGSTTAAIRAYKGY